MVRAVGLRELAGRRDGRCRGRWQPASVQVVELSSSITCKAFTHTTCSTPRPHYFGRVRGRPGSVGVGYAGMSQMQTLVTRLGGELAGYGRIAAVHFSVRQELAAVSAPTGNARRNRRLVRRACEGPK